MGHISALPPIDDMTPEAKLLEEDREELRVTEIVAQGPRGTVALAAFSVGVVMALWLAFYLYVFLPRGPIG